MLSQCLDSSRPQRIGGRVKEEDREKGMLGHAEDHSASGNVPELKVPELKAEVVC